MTQPMYKGMEDLKDTASKMSKSSVLMAKALREIADTDYRGNRSTESQIAFDALKKVDEIWRSQ